MVSSIHSYLWKMRKIHIKPSLAAKKIRNINGKGGFRTPLDHKVLRQTTPQANMPMSSKEMSRTRRRSHSRNTILEAAQKRAKPLSSPSGGSVGSQEASVACPMDTTVVHINQARLTWMRIDSSQYSKRLSGVEGLICSMMVMLAMMMR